MDSAHVLSSFSLTPALGHGTLPYPSKSSFVSQDSSNILALKVINLLQQNIAVKQMQHPAAQYQPGAQGSKHYLAQEYQKIKQMIDKSGLLLPNENLITKTCGECFWTNCHFQSDVKEIFRSHMIECHQLSPAALVQLELSLEKSLYLSSMLLREQNYIYNMLMHLDNKMKTVQSGQPFLNDNQYFSILLNKLKHSSNVFDCSSSNMERMNCNLPSYTAAAHQMSSQSSMNSHSSTFPRPFFSPNTRYHQRLSSVNRIFEHNLSINGLEFEVPKHDSDIAADSNIGVVSQSPTVESGHHELHSISQFFEAYYPSSHSSVSIRTSDQISHDIRPALSDDQEKHVEMNITVDREYYRHYSVRPSISYVNLIKTAILESPKRELSLNEIYLWMQSEFVYFRDREQKWKNAIRHNLSLHKCFQRKHGKLWTFDEKEYKLKKSRN